MKETSGNKARAAKPQTADYVITPVLKDLFSYNAAGF
jgi:hypothetical protein